MTRRSRQRARAAVVALLVSLALPGAAHAYEPPPGCVAWYDGCNWCSRIPGVPGAACTKRACIDEPQPESPRCTEWEPGAGPDADEVAPEPPRIEDAPPVSADVVDADFATSTPTPAEVPMGIVARLLNQLSHLWQWLSAWFS